MNGELPKTGWVYLFFFEDFYSLFLRWEKEIGFGR